jgi:hypothetical protein
LSLISNEELFLSECLKSEINKKYPHFIFSKISNYFNFSKVSKLNLRFSITNLEMAFTLTYKPSTPLNFIFNNKIIEIYDSIFKYFLRFNIFQLIIAKIFSVFKNQKKLTHFIFLKITKIINKSFCLLKSFQGYLFNEVIMYITCI